MIPQTWMTRQDSNIWPIGRPHQERERNRERKQGRKTCRKRDRTLNWETVKRKRERERRRERDNGSQKERKAGRERGRKTVAKLPNILLIILLTECSNQSVQSDQGDKSVACTLACPRSPLKREKEREGESERKNDIIVHWREIESERKEMRDSLQ